MPRLLKSVNLILIFSEGTSREGDVLDLAVEKEVVEKSGASYSYKKKQDWIWA